MISEQDQSGVGALKAAIVIPWTQPSSRPAQSRLEETAGLAEALGCKVGILRAENVRKPSPAYMLSGGLLERLALDIKESGCDLAVIDSSLTPIQQRNLERRLHVKVLDRTGLILEIFGLRAATKEGRLQVELARLNYERSRLVRTWTHLERQRGGRGFLGGPGETQLESDKRMIDRNLVTLERDLKAVKRTRRVQREGRSRDGRIVVSLIGYTNVGKSTLFNLLSNASVLAQDMPFATLDTTARRVVLPRLGEITLIDTVGFITELPTHLVDSFRATLEETLDADLLLHVRDRSTAVDGEQKQDVINIMNDIAERADVILPPILEVWNKVDLMDELSQSGLRQQLDTTEQNACIISATNQSGIAQLIERIEHILSYEHEYYKLVLASKEGAARAWLHDHAIIEHETIDEKGNFNLGVSMTKAQHGRFSSLFSDMASRLN